MDKTCQILKKNMGQVLVFEILVSLVWWTVLILAYQNYKCSAVTIGKKKLRGEDLWGGAIIEQIAARSKNRVSKA